MFQSEIRHSTINSLIEKVQKRDYRKYLYKVILSCVRGFNDQVITFDFPVTAIVGPNGGGKTTILGAAGCAYASVKPRQFFAKSGSLDESMLNWKIEYEIIDREKNAKDSIRRTATFLRSKWSRDAVARDIVVFGVSRTVPANERVEFKKLASKSFTIEPEKIKKIEASVASAVTKILGKNISEYSHISVDHKGRVSLLAGQTDTGTQYSEFHFGAGESSIIRMVMKIESLPDNLLILIEEIENGLHPVATVRMVEYLVDVANRKKAQAIFTTHSNDALLPLPSQAIWAAIGKSVFQGKLDIHSLRAITDQIEAQLVIFTEDVFSKYWIEAMLRAYGNLAIDLIEVHSMEGDGPAVQVNKYHNLDPSKKFPSVCFIDGDSRQEESIEDRVFRLPGQVPESHIYDGVSERLDNELAGRLAVALLEPYENQKKVAQIIHDIRQTNRDPHILYSQVGKRLKLIPEDTVRRAFLSIWTQAYPAEVQKIIQLIENLLPKEKNT